MLIQYTNRKGTVFYLCQVVTTNGKPRYYFAREPKGKPVAQIPVGFRITESVNGVVSLSKDIAPLVLPAELAAVQSAVRKHPKTDLYRIGVKRNRIEVYERDGPVADDMLEGFQSGGLFPSSMRGQIETMLAEDARFSPVVRFTLTDARTRLYRLERTVYTGMGGWRHLFPDGPIEEQAERIIPRLGSESYFDIYWRPGRRCARRMMADKPDDWAQLAGRSLQTSTGARFTVVRVTARAVTVRPEKGLRDYSLSIPNELERAVVAYRKGRFFPSPADLQHAGFSAILSSYTWAVLRAMLIDDTKGISARAAFQEKDLIGYWRIMSLEIGDDYVAEGDKPPFVSFDKVSYGTLLGEYYFGLSSGELAGHLREFGGEQVLLFAFAGSDEMDQANGAGWVQMTSPHQLEGEFLNDYGRFAAKRDVQKSKRVRRSDSNKR